MNTWVILPLILCVVHAADKQDVKAKTTSSPVNTIQQNPKYEMVYQTIKYQQPVAPMQQHLQVQAVPLQQLQHLQHYQQPQHKTHYLPLQIIPKQYYVPTPQPQAMIIIAQPALLPQSLVYGSATQQLLNYFHSNPQAKYQLLHGNYQQQPQLQQQVQPTATYMHPVLAQPAVSNYVLTAAPQVSHPQLIAQTSPTPALQYTTQQSHVQMQHTQQPQIQVQHTQQPQIHIQPQQQQQQQQQPQLIQQQQSLHHLSSLAHLAQLAAQQYVSTQMKSAPAIVTGFEHFTPEQQAQIKAQLSTHLGGNFHAVSTASNGNQYSAKYAEQDNNNFVPSPQVKNEPVSTVSSQTTDILKTRFNMKKN